MTQPKITCSIICYNYGKFLSQAIDSCLSQTINKDLFEILVIDDGSTDNTPEICARYGDKIRVSRTANQGFSISLERALKEAKGEYVAYLDADDYWMPDKLEKVLKEIEKGALVVMHPLVEVDEYNNLLGNIGACGNTSSVCIQRLAGLSLLPATSEIFCRPVLDSGKGIELKEALGYYRIHGAAMTDRSPNNSHTAFFAKTNHVTANRLYELVNEVPLWADSSKQVKRIADWYRGEGYIKDFQRLTETREKKKYVAGWIRMVGGMIKSHRLPAKREFRFTIRAVLQMVYLKK